MTMGQQKDRQGDLMVGWAEMPRSPGHVFYDRLQSVLIEGGFDGFAEAACRSYYAARLGAPSVPPGRYFRMHLVGYFEGIDSERGLEWRCSDSLSLREFLRLESRDRVPDHSWLSRTCARLPHEVHTAIFDWVLALIAEAGLVKGERIGVDASTMEANAALRNIVRRDTGGGYRGMLARLAQESGIETPTAEDLARLDRKRKGKKLSNQDWVSKSDPEAKIAKMKDGTTHLAYKPEHAVDLDTGAVVAAELHPADEGDTTTLEKTLAPACPATGSVKVKRAPRPGPALSARMRPPWASTSPLQMARPRPDPPVPAPVSPPAALEYLRNSCARRSGGMPLPSSATETATCIPSRSAAIRIGEDSGAWRAALASRLFCTCSTRWRSAMTRGRSGGRSMVDGSGALADHERPGKWFTGWFVTGRSRIPTRWRNTPSPWGWRSRPAAASSWRAAVGSRPSTPASTNAPSSSSSPASNRRSPPMTVPPTRPRS